MGVMIKPPIYSRGTYAKLVEALDSGALKNLDRLLWHYVTEGEYAGQLCMVDTEKTIVRVVGNNNEQIQPLIDRISELAQKAEDIETGLEDIKTQLNNVYTKTEVNDLISETTYSKDEVDNKVDIVDQKVSGIEEKVDEVSNWLEV